jgi:hypothetical protein
VNPKTVYPIHTEHPELFKKLSMKSVIVEEGATYTL